jgi:hypothetical protein
MAMAGDRPLGAPRGREDPQAVVRGPDLTPAETRMLRARQRLRNRVMLVVLLGLVVLFFAITISRMSQVQDPREWSRPGGIAPVQTAPSR